MGMRVSMLASGSSGNAFYAESQDGAVIIDAGLSGRKLLDNLHLAGGRPEKVLAVIVTHDHTDHVKGAGILQRKFGWKLIMTPGTRDKAADELGKVSVNLVPSNSGVCVAGFKINFIKTPHDATDPFAVVLERNGKRCGVFTDLGHNFSGLQDILNTLDLLFLESNYDPAMLADNRRYPEHLKNRIKSCHGHISNHEAAEIVNNLSSDRLYGVILSHLSEQNNHPELALTNFKKMVSDKIRSGLRVGVALRHVPQKLFRVTEREKYLCS